MKNITFSGGGNKRVFMCCGAPMCNKTVSRSAKYSVVLENGILTTKLNLTWQLSNAPIGPRWTPWWPHALCYLGSDTNWHTTRRWSCYTPHGQTYIILSSNIRYHILTSRSTKMYAYLNCDEMNICRHFLYLVWWLSWYTLMNRMPTKNNM